MDEVNINRIFNLQEKLNQEVYKETVEFLREHKLSISWQNFDYAQQCLFNQKRTSYCDYIFFLRSYFFKNYDHENI